MQGLDEAADQIIAEYEARIARVSALKNAEPETIGKVVKKAIDCWREGDDLSLAYQWLFKPNFLFEGLMPLELAIMGRESEVLDRIRATKNGVNL